MIPPFKKVLTIVKISSTQVELSNGSIGSFVTPPSGWKKDHEVIVQSPASLEKNLKGLSVTNITVKNTWPVHFSKSNDEGQPAQMTGPVPIAQYEGFDKKHVISKTKGNNVMLDDGSKWNLTDFSKDFELSWEPDEVVIPYRGSSANKMNFSRSTIGSKICKMVNTDRRNQELTATYLNE